MKAILCDITALEYWRRASAAGSGSLRMFALTPEDLTGQALPLDGSPIEVDPPCAELAGLLEHHGLATPKCPAHVLVTQRRDSRVLPNVVCKLCSSPLPKESLYPVYVGDTALRGIYVASPELALMQLCSHDPGIAAQTTLPLMIMELCGTYRCVDDTLVSRCPPLTTPGALLRFAQSVKGYKGAVPLAKAAKLCCAGAASPAEASLALAFSLPYRMGGANLKISELNPQLQLAPSVARMLGRDTISPDIVLIGPKGKLLVIEYDSKTWHDSRDQANYDERRRNAYAALGLACIVVRSRHLASTSQLSAIIEVVQKNLGVRVRDLPKDYYSKRLELHNELFAYWRKPIR